MRNDATIAVIIPTLNEEASIAKVLAAIPKWVDDIIVADNGSEDNTVLVAKNHGARVVHEPRRGYGSACLQGIAALDAPDVVVFLDGDFSDHPEQMDTLVDPIIGGDADIVIGSRVLGRHEPGALTPQARFGNQLACFLIRLFWGVRYTDLGPFRAIRHATLEALAMADPDYGWTVEMQIKAALHGAASIEVPVDYRKRIGKSKVSGTVRGVVGAGYKILSTIFLSALRHYTGRKPTVAGRQHLIVFTRYPEAGKTKTRLIPALGADGAADLQRKMTERAVATAVKLVGASIEIRYDGGTEETMKAWLGDRLAYRPQDDGGLGERMAGAFREAFRKGATRAVIIGIDCPEITAAILRAAFKALERNDMVLGPATDGGYYLIGLRRAARGRAIPAVFDGVPWGTETVFERSVEIAASKGLRLARLAPLDDVDRPEDLGVWERAQRHEPAPAITVIIPTLDESENVSDTISSAQQAEDVEILVVDGGSSDNTQAIARQLGATVIPSPQGRAAQMNLGSAKARGTVLLFLHADTRLPQGYAREVHDLLAQPGTAAGAFHFGTDNPTRTMRLMGWGANLRSSYLRMPYGDQALFLSKDLFRELGGYPQLPIMEDFEFIRRLSRHGTIRIAPSAVTTSARRWQRLGPWRTLVTNQIAVAAYYLGVSSERIARFYHHRPNDGSGG